MISTCLVCGGPPQPFLSCPDWLTSAGTFSLARCTACNFVWTTDAPDAQQIERFYGPVYEQSIHPRLAHPVLRRARMAIQTAARARMVERRAGSRRGNVLDIGCGDGDFLQAMLRRGWDVTGVELSHEKRKKLKASGIRAVEPDQWPEFPIGSFDAVTLWHSLEHLYEPLDTLRHLRRLLVPGGICVIAVPNADSPQAKRDGAAWFGYDVPRHLWHFTPATLTRLLDQAGFHVREFRPTRIDGFTITLLMMHVQKRRDWKRAVVKSLLRDVLLARTFRDASCMICIASI
jgi:SAM-dependent methyltransferase